MLDRTGWDTVLVGAVLAMLFASPSTPARGDEPEGAVEAVASVDLDRYSGLWYEIARLPNRFQDDCACCVTATYTRRSDGRLDVVNACRTADGDVKRAEGVAKLAKKEGPASKLKVRFAPAFLSFLGFVWGDYWVLELDEDYTHALVGDPGRKYLWVLSREPTIDGKTYEALLEKAASMGFDVSRIERTLQGD
jgi:apolipoprotein D and lipocalin family protein